MDPHLPKHILCAVRSRPGGEETVDRAIALAYNRTAQDDDLDLVREFVAKHGLPAYCRILFNSNEFLYVR